MFHDTVWKIKTVLTRNNINKCWKLSIGMCQSNVPYFNYVLSLIINLIKYDLFHTFIGIPDRGVRSQADFTMYQGSST